MAEGLREVADHLAGAGIDLLGEEAHVVDGGYCAVEGRGGGLDVTLERLRMRQPERAHREGAFIARQAVLAAIPVHEPALIG